MALKGKQVEFTDFSKRIGIAEFKLVAISPDLEGIKKLYPNNTQEKEPNYIISKSDDKGDYEMVNIALYLQNVETQAIDKTNIMVFSRDRVSKDGKKQYINSVGNTLWAFSEDNIKEMLEDVNTKDGYKTYIANFVKRPYRVSLQGEDLVYEFIQKLTKIDTRDPEAEILYNNKKWFKNDFSELKKDLLSTTYKDNTIVGNYDIVSKRVDAHPDEQGNIISESWKFYQGIYNRFLRGSYMSSFTNPKSTYPKEVKTWMDMISDPQNGDKNFFAVKKGEKYIFELARDYVEGENPITSSNTKHEDNGENGQVPDNVSDLPF